MTRRYSVRVTTFFKLRSGQCEEFVVLHVPFDTEEAPLSISSQWLVFFCRLFLSDVTFACCINFRIRFGTTLTCAISQWYRDTIDGNKAPSWRCKITYGLVSPQMLQHHTIDVTHETFATRRTPNHSPTHARTPRHIDTETPCPRDFCCDVHSCLCVS